MKRKEQPPLQNAQQLDALAGDQLRAHALKHGFVLDDSLANCDVLGSNETVPWPDVKAARRNRRLQGKHAPEEGKSRYLAEAAPCPNCKTPADGLSWFYFESPKETWPAECGCAGWMVVCDQCRIQVHFFIEVVS